MNQYYNTAVCAIARELRDYSMDRKGRLWYWDGIKMVKANRPKGL